MTRFSERRSLPSGLTPHLPLLHPTKAPQEFAEGNRATKMEGTVPHGNAATWSAPCDPGPPPNTTVTAAAQPCHAQSPSCGPGMAPQYRARASTTTVTPFKEIAGLRPGQARTRVRVKAKTQTQGESSCQALRSVWRLVTSTPEAPTPPVPRATLWWFCSLTSLQQVSPSC